MELYPSERVANENIRLANTQQQGKKEDTSLAKQKRADGKPVGKVVYLTFDDGPSELTGKFLDVLKEQHVASTFLCKVAIYRILVFRKM